MTARNASPGRTALLILALVAALVAVPGCGCSSCDYNEVIVDTYWGNVFVSNLTPDLVPVEWVDTFFLAPVDGDFTANLLPTSLPPGRTQFVGTFGENLYDAEADTSIAGEPFDLVTWFEIFVGAADDVYFEVY